MNIAFVCNQNLARSRVLSAFFSKLLPHHAFSSYGVIAIEGRRHVRIINSISRKWELPISGGGARSVSAHQNEILACDVIFAVSQFICSYIRDLGFTGTIVDLEFEASKLGIELHDPQLISQSRCEMEYLKVAYSSFIDLKLLAAFKFTAIMPTTEVSNENVLSLLNKIDDPKTVLYGDMIAPVRLSSNLNRTSVSKYRFNQKSKIIECPDLVAFSDCHFLMPSHPVLAPHLLYLSGTWSTFLASLDSENLFLISPPMRKSQGVVPESFLSVLGAREIRSID
jgi:protein-tyrosine-phosphatase